MPQVIIIGAGLAGLTAALELSRQELDVLVLEKKSLPRHKVCGEYLSQEVLPYFDQLEIGFPDRPIVNRFFLSTSSGKYVERELPLGGVGITRKVLDNLLYEKARANGARVDFHTKVQEVRFANNKFHVTTVKGEVYTSKVVLAAYGKGPGWHSFSDVKNVRKPIYLGAKQYYRYQMDEDLVVLHNFKGGYCGAVRVEDDTVDVAYMVKQSIFTKFKSTELMEEKLLHVNPFLRKLLTNGEPVLERPLTVSNFQLGNRKLVHDHILYAGDAAALIPPASGNGMAMAIWGGRHAARSIELYLRQRFTREKMETHYRKSWQRHLGPRLYWGKHFQRLMGKGWTSEIAMVALQSFPDLLPYLVSLTHAKSTYEFDQ